MSPSSTHPTPLASYLNAEYQTVTHMTRQNCLYDLIPRYRWTYKVTQIKYTIPLENIRSPKFIILVNAVSTRYPMCKIFGYLFSNILLFAFSLRPRANQIFSYKYLITYKWYSTLKCLLKLNVNMPGWTTTLSNPN